VRVRAAQPTGPSAGDRDDQAGHSEQDELLWGADEPGAGKAEHAERALAVGQPGGDARRERAAGDRETTEEAGNAATSAPAGQRPRSGAFAS
jgi:hypothetical protein